MYFCYQYHLKYNTPENQHPGPSLAQLKEVHLQGKDMDHSKKSQTIFVGIYLKNEYSLYTANIYTKNCKLQIAICIYVYVTCKI